jgi:DNA polymerase-3 subunit alpha
MTNEWVSLHHHSTYSFGDGFGTPGQHAERAAELGYKSMALTEHGNVSSHFRYEQAAAKAGIRPVFGLEAYCGPVNEETRSRTKYHLILLAKDTGGYRNLNQLVTQSWKDFYQYPTVSGANLAEHHNGLVCLSGCTGSMLACKLVGGKEYPDRLDRPDMSAASMFAGKFLDLFGDDYYLEVQGFPELEKTCVINPCYEVLSKELGIPLVATMDIHYPQPDDNIMQQILHATDRGGKTIDQQSQNWEYDVRLTLPESDGTLFRKLVDTGLSRRAASQAIANATNIASRCDVTLPKAERLKFPGTDDSLELLWSWLRRGWKFRGLQDRPKHERDWYAERVKYEMGIFASKDLADFLLFTSDVIRWGKREGISFGPGRGSSASSVVCWLLRITEIDPQRHPLLLFERFIDLNRADPPDIDVDCSDEERWKVRDYLAEKYGPDRVGQIANFVRYRGKNALQDVAHVYGIPKHEVKIVSDLVIERSGGDSRFDASLGDTVGMFPNAKEVFDRHPDLWKATRLEGNTKGMSVHAAGIIVANSPLTDICAVYEQKGVRALSIDKYDAEYAGAVKLDFLGLSTMGMISLCLKMAGLTLEDLYAIPDDDPETLKMFQNGDVTGVFQFEGRATRLVNRDVHPDNFAEVSDVNALARPGPLFSGTTAEYCDVKHGRREPERYHEITDRITALTKGQIIYQEQILQIVREVGGFDWGHSIEIRRIISKKLGQAAFQVSMGTFVDGAARLHGIDAATAEKIWKRIVTSGTYSFVNAHSVAYSMLAWWCAWLKTHYPAEFYAASLSKAPDDQAALRLMKDAERHGIKISPPMLALSNSRWSVDYSTNSVVAGWDSIPKLGEVMARKISDYIAEHGRVRNWSDLTVIRGVGDKSVAAWEQFASHPDPFGIQYAAQVLGAVRSAILSGKLPVPRPTHTGDDMVDVPDTSGPSSPKRGARGGYTKGEKIVYAGIVRAREYQNAAENERSRTGDDMDVIMKRMKKPELQDYCVLRCYDDGEEDVYIRTTRYSFPQLKRTLESISVGHDIVVVRGRKSPGFGTSVFAEEIFVIEP